MCSDCKGDGRFIRFGHISLCFCRRHMKTSVRGVFHRPDCKTRPYFFITTVKGVKKKSWFSTLEAAAAAKKAKESAKVAATIAKRAPLKEKRARDVRIYGNACKLERDVSIELETCADATYGPGTAIVMNDGTVADVLFKLGEAYLQLQLKTTATTHKNRNGYRFAHVLGYAGMLVVCWVVDLKKAWVFDGTWLNERGQEHYFFTPGYPTETHALAKALTMDELIAYLHDHAHAAHLRLTTEDAARNEFKGKENRQEKFGIDAYTTFKPGTHDWPRDQNGEYDTLWTCEDEEKTLRVQHKSCYPNGNRAGLFCRTLGKSDGRDLNGKRLYTCYDKDDADLYVFHYHHEAANTSHFWEIPSEALAEHEFFTKTTGRESIYLYGCPVAKQPNPNANNKADTWTSAFYTGSLRRDLNAVCVYKT